MSAKVLASITEQTPWGELPHIEGQSLAAVAAEREPVVCSYCKEPIVHDGDIWRHVRTGLSAHWRSKECRPLCRDCGAPAIRAIGDSAFIGSGIAFVVDHFACEACARKSTFIEHVR